MPVTIPSSMIEAVAMGTTGQGDIWNNVFALSTTVTVTDSLLTSLAGDIQSLYNTLATAGMFYSGWRLTNVRFSYNDGLGNIATVDKAVAVSGTTANAEPGQLAIVASHKTGLAGPSFRGRTYLGPLGTGTTASDGSILTSLRTTIVNAFTSFRSALSGHNSAQVVWSRKLVSFKPVTSTQVGPYVDTQRRRRSVLRG